MSRKAEDINRLTENTYKTVMEQFNPGLRNLVNLGKNYEKAVSAMVAAGKIYFDGISKLGELSSQSPVSKELGQVLMEISEVHKKVNIDMEDNFRKFHKDLISELEKKTDQDMKYMNATLKKYQTEHRTKLDSLEKSQAELKKLRRKSQGTKNAYKYESKEMEFLATISTRENDIQRFITEGCKEALLEEKRRFCFLVDKHCSFSQDLSNYHEKANGLLSAKLNRWKEKCFDATKVPEFLGEGDSPSSYISRTPQPSPLMGRYTVHDAALQNNLRIPPAPPGRFQKSPLPDMFNNPTAQRMASGERNTEALEDVNLTRSISVATGLNMVQRPKVKSIFPHTAGNSKNMLSFAEGDVLTLLIPEEKDGWLYGEHDLNKMRGWFPTSYTRPLEQGPDMSSAPSTAPARSMSILNLAERSNVVLPPPDYVSEPVKHHNKEVSFHSYSSAPSRGIVPQSDNTSSSSEANGVMKPPFLSGGNPFTTVKLRPTVTNDRSAPVI
ncbi:BAR/IMD domain-containing adapter protein 2-like 1 [Heterodontus francisci]|uniref:BAR/IMD domain-containing adapter protein 2-like 1 n=1 Tax=Heterodontus francisci TaxID=7792 RepID=UPI00355B6351